MIHDHDPVTLEDLYRTCRPGIESIETHILGDYLEEYGEIDAANIARFGYPATAMTLLHDPCET